MNVTELKDNFKEDTAMLQISEIVKKTEEIFDLFNEHFYNNKLTRRQSPETRTEDAALMAAAVSMKSGTQTMSCIGKSTFAQNTLTAPFLSRPQLFYMKWPTSTISNMIFRT